MAIAFDGLTKTITLSPGATVVTVAEIYSRWKDWITQSDNFKFPPAFREAGGDSLGGGLYSSINVFIRNDTGWRVKPPEQHIIVDLIGNIYPEDPLTIWRVATVGTFRTAINTNNSANALVLASTGGGSGLTAADVWAYDVSSSAAPGSAGQRLRDSLTKLFFKS